MSFLHKLFFIIQLAYYLHMLPELYFQKIKKEEQPSKIKHSIAGFVIITFFYLLNFNRVALVLLTFHYLTQLINSTFQLVEIFDKEEKYAKCETEELNSSKEYQLTDFFRFSPSI